MSLLRSFLRESSPIQSFIIFDTEATGLEDPKLTEICFLGILRDDLLAGGSEAPRVTNKLVLFIDPRKNLSASALKLTGLTNAKLTGQRPFDEDMVQSMTAFIRRLPQPVCLVSHSGNRFDFPVLNSELKQIAQTLPGDLLCADSLLACKEIEPRGETLSLDNIYKRIFGHLPPAGHTAEGDCMALLKIILKKPKTFVNWMDAHSKPLKRIPPKY